MEIKKSPKANLEDKRLTFVFMGLIVALAILYTAFEWTQREITVHEADNEDFLIEEEIQIDQTFQEETPPPPPEPEEVPDVIEEIKIVEDDVETKDVDFSSEDKKDEVVEIKQVVIDEEEDIEEVFLVVEEQPEFPGGMAKLMKYFSDNVRYPVVAAENGIQGRVICQFTVWRDGSIRDIVVLRGVDKSLDKEAVRLIENMPKWKPGKQRGKEVSCKFTVPVSFRLQ